ncbi:hypothetical protein M885DRAFT_517792 [Pelagophyceae sp. CCMP2097]|nr:hypothetical protein M885DRAFT_517792 [Pelagophyceae sp. CCMP2097]|mmetsp:Transcript_164/g.625  ORF Transcript_164/g.625 Transcript_164/m.625 type:complete len:399 (-) Transcript_164:190-1386(-)
MAPHVWAVPLALVVVQFNFAVGGIVATLALPAMNPLLFAAIREAVAGPSLAIIALRLGGPEPFRRLLRGDSRGRVFLVGAFVSVMQLLGIVGIKLSSNAVLFSIWQPTQPIFVVAASIVLRWEAINVNRLFGIACAFAGCIVVASSSFTGGSQGPNELLANALFCAAAVTGAAYAVASKPVLLRHPSIVITACCYSVAGVLTVAAALIAAASPSASRFVCPDCVELWTVPRSAVPALAWWTVMSTIVNYSLQMWSIKHSSPTLCTAAAALQPVMTAAMSLLLLNLRPALGCGFGATKCLRQPTLLDALGGLAIIAGLMMVVRTERVSKDPDSHALEESLLHDALPHDAPIADAPAAAAPPLNADTAPAGDTSTLHTSTLRTPGLRTGSRSANHVGRLV